MPPLICMRKDVKSGLILPDHLAYFNFEESASASTNNAYVAVYPGWNERSYGVFPPFDNYAFTSGVHSSSKYTIYNDPRLNVGDSDFSLEAWIKVSPMTFPQMLTGSIFSETMGASVGFGLTFKGSPNYTAHIFAGGQAFNIPFNSYQWVVLARINGVSKLSLAGNYWVTIPNLPKQKNGVMYMGAGEINGSGAVHLDDVCFSIGKSRHSFDKAPVIPDAPLNLTSF